LRGSAAPIATPMITASFSLSAAAAPPIDEPTPVRCATRAFERLQCELAHLHYRGFNVELCPYQLSASLLRPVGLGQQCTG
jgi:hypothetical protein